MKYVKFSYSVRLAGQVACIFNVVVCAWAVAANAPAQASTASARVNCLMSSPPEENFTTWNPDYTSGVPRSTNGSRDWIAPTASHLLLLGVALGIALGRGLAHVLGEVVVRRERVRREHEALGRHHLGRIGTL